MNIDEDAEIGITEWIANAIDKKSLMGQENLEIAFNWFDKDGGGTIDANEVKARLKGANSEIDEGVWDSIIDEVDQNGDREYIGLPTTKRLRISSSRSLTLKKFQKSKGRSKLSTTILIRSLIGLE